MYEINTALIATFDEERIQLLSGFLLTMGVKIIATDNTINFLQLKDHNNVISVSKYIDIPNTINDRSKILHPAILMGITFDHSNEQHNQIMNNNSISPIDLVIVNLYPFIQNCSPENVDIAGSSLIKFAANNYQNVCVIVDPFDYKLLINELKRNTGKISFDFSYKMAAKAMMLATEYDLTIASWHKSLWNITNNNLKKNDCSQSLFVQLNGGELNYANLLDVDIAVNLIAEFTKPTVVIIKQSVPIGGAIASDFLSAYSLARSCNPRQNFGGIVAVNGMVNEELAVMITETFTEVVVAYKFNEDAVNVFQKKKGIIVLKINCEADMKNEISLFYRDISDILAQDYIFMYNALKVVSEKQPTTEQVDDMIFAHKINKHIAHNSVVLVKNSCVISSVGGYFNSLHFFNYLCF